MVVKVSYNITTPTIRVTYSDNSVYVKTTQASSSIFIKVGYGIDHVNWGDIGGTLSDQVDLQSALDAKVDDTTTITINGTTQDLSSNSTWTVGDMLKSVYDTDDNGIVDHAESMVTTCRNSTGSTIYKGTIVYLSGSTGNRPNIVKALATSDATSAQTFGVVEDDIANNSDGRVVTLGAISNLDTRSSATHPFTSDTLADGDILYLSPTTPGYVTNVKPYAPNHIVYVGMVVRTHPTLGTIVYRIQNGYELDELHNVSAQTPSNNDGLFYESSTSLWKNKSIATVLGYTPYSAANPSGYISSITSGMVTTALGYTPVTNARTLTINGTAYDLSADRSWTISSSNIYSADGTLTGNRTLTSGGYNLTFTGTNVASGAIARVILMNNTLTAAANNDVLVGLDINPTYNFGAFSGISNFGLRVSRIGSFTDNQIFFGTSTTTTRGINFDIGQSAIKGIDVLRLDFTNNFLDFRYNPSGTATTYGRFYTTGNFALQNGGTFTDNGARLQVTGTGYFSDSVGVGTSTLTGSSLKVSKNITGATISYGVLSNGVVQNDVTTLSANFASYTNTVGSQSITYLVNYYASQQSIGASSTISTQIGYYVDGLTSGGNNYGFQGALTAGTNRYNLYMSGTANNYMAGNLGIGTTSLTDSSLRVQKNITGSTIYYNVFSGGTVLSDVTSQAVCYVTLPTTQATTFTLSNLMHFYAVQQTFGAGSTVTNQSGFHVDNTLVGATNNYGFYGNIASGTNRWNLYMNGTASNYLAGKLLVGTTTDAASAIVNIASTTQGFLMPRMTTAQRDAITTPATGLSVYNTTLNTNDYYNGTAWVSLAAGNIYTTDGTLTGNRTVTMGTYGLTYSGSGAGSANRTFVTISNFNTNSAAGIRLVNGNNRFASFQYSGSAYITNETFSIFTESDYPILFCTNGNTTSGGTSYISFSPGGYNNEAARIFGSKNFIIGGTTDAGYKLDVQGTGRFTGGASFTGGSYVANSVYYSATYGLVIASATNGSTSDFGIADRTANFAFQVLSTGNISQNSTTFKGAVNIGTSSPAVINKSALSGLLLTGTAGTSWHGGFVESTGNNGLFIDSNGFVKIGVYNSTFNSSAILEAVSTTKGFLPPRMTNAQRTAISTPSVGLMVYCTDAVEGLYIYKSTGWTFVI